MIRTASLLVAAFAWATAALAADDYPGRDLYKDVKVVTLEQLDKTLDQSLVVDVRTPYEFDTIHIHGAINLPMSKGDFREKIKALREGSPKPIVFYCNGHTCYKSYKAVRTVQAFGVNDVYAFDAGVFDWARAYPDRAVLLGKRPIDPSRLISKEDHKAHMLEAKDFEERATQPGYVVLDVRSRMQRSASGLFPGGEKWASLDDSPRLTGLINDARKEKKTLLIYDEVGKQVQWLEYRLRDMGVENYYFMKNGAEGFYAHLGVPKDLLSLSK